MLGKICGREVKPSHGEPRAGDIRESLADISRARTRDSATSRASGVEEEGLRALVESVKR